MAADIKNGISVTKSAIKNGDVLLLGKCLNRFVSLKSPIADIQAAIEDCPIEMIKRAGVKLTIFSELLNRNIVIGQDISYDALADIVRLQPSKETIALMFEAQQITQGEIETILHQEAA